MSKTVYWRFQPPIFRARIFLCTHFFRFFFFCWFNSNILSLSLGFGVLWMDCSELVIVCHNFTLWFFVCAFVCVCKNAIDVFFLVPFIRIMFSRVFSTITITAMDGFFVFWKCIQRYVWTCAKHSYPHTQTTQRTWRTFTEWRKWGARERRCPTVCTERNSKSRMKQPFSRSNFAVVSLNLQ